MAELEQVARRIYEIHRANGNGSLPTWDDLSEHFKQVERDCAAVAAEVIVADTRRQVAEELRAEAARLDIADDPFALDMALAAHWLTDRNAAIARGRGETGGGQ